MTHLAQKLTEYRVADVMHQPVVAVSSNASMDEAARVLTERGFSGAPVIDEMGRCVGVLSATDFTRRDQPPADDSHGVRGATTEMVDAWPHGPRRIDQIAGDRVHQHMTPAVQTIGPDQSLLDAARYMSSGQISRLLVVDSTARPVGILGSLDILEVFVRSCDEEAAAS